ncbi:putative quinol monooxygenase [Entomobacter blattae]|uniref:Antibiotic biosynthesis monooxygenase n=1 Tax=Entomobacter blattae TaxID=2762277 RepID=A0A7H1NPA8_9PROT|nr:putative quinol monooxygenase [Entomobacter blattae]QNT77618.1 Antibiotic biosynthesis monooxygenase [Entomobacter blattae]
MSNQIGIVAILDFKEGGLEKALPAIKACVKGSQQEEGNVFYTAHRESAHPERIIFVERWKNQHAIDQHGKTTHFQNLVGAVTPLLSKPMVLHFLDEIEVE